MDKIKTSLDSDTPEKHKHRPAEYKRYLENELSAAKAAIEELKAT
jgi:hypothetical protein